jgi:hypothetical protein
MTVSTSRTSDARHADVTGAMTERLFLCASGGHLARGMDSGLSDWRRNEVTVDQLVQALSVFLNERDATVAALGPSITKLGADLAALGVRLKACEEALARQEAPAPTPTTPTPTPTTPAPTVPVGWWNVAEKTSSYTKVYVSTAGNDVNNGLSSNAPKRTIAAAQTALPTGGAILLKRGETFDGGVQWKHSGTTAAPVVLGAYGTGPNPVVRGGLSCTGGGGTPTRVDNVVIADVDFVGSASTNAANLLRGGTSWLLQNCAFRNGSVGLNLNGYDGHWSAVTIRGCRILDNKPTGGTHAQGIYADRSDGVVIEHNVLDNNGQATVYAHNIYVQNGCTSVTLRGNIIMNGGSHGCQVRCGGIVEDNFFFRNAIQCLVGGGDTPEAGGVSAFVSRNLIVESKDIDASQPRGWALELENVRQGHVEDNVVLNHISTGTLFRAFQISEIPAGGTAIPVRRNIFRGAGNVLLGNGVSTDNVHSTSRVAVNLPADFVTVARGMTQATWNEAYRPVGLMARVRQSL